MKQFYNLLMNCGMGLPSMYYHSSGKRDRSPENYRNQCCGVLFFIGGHFTILSEVSYFIIWRYALSNTLQEKLTLEQFPLSSMYNIQ